MGRTPREKSEFGLYHVRLRGNDRQILFDSDAERLDFLRLMRERLVGQGVTVLAWCLMSNHVHIIALDEDDLLSSCFHDLASIYAREHNMRTGHLGHVFQTPFRSSPINDESYLLEAVRYVHNNPAHEGICTASEWPWSSYQEYVGRSAHGIASTGLVLDLLGGVRQFEEFTAHFDDESLLPSLSTRMSDDEALELARRVLPGCDPRGLKGSDPSERDRALRALSAAGLSNRQIERVCGIGRKTVARAVRHAAPLVPGTNGATRC